ncbi:low molecular weight phosphatase family protein [Donghicola sp. XS_ASV15]|uniref:arsenate-mycothiol transferase ArsC n=1 Tax=Donghicola sp. XS_ASV15 TaxID=3241295 RepID=UPI0035140A40
MNILVLCAGNDARSILLESILNDLSPQRMTAYSAGPAPAESVPTAVLDLLESRDHGIADLDPQSWEAFTGPSAVPVDVVIGLCDLSAYKAPKWPAGAPRGIWLTPDPMAGEATLESVYESLLRRAKAFLKHSFEIMDEGEANAALKRIGKL